VSKSDEALALIIYENNYERWLSMAKAEDWSSSVVRPKYTTGGNANQTPKRNGKKKIKGGAKQNQLEGIDTPNILNFSTTSKYLGWSVTGINRFNELFDAIHAERMTKAGNDFDEVFLTYSLDQKEKSKKKQKIDNNVYATCRHEMWNDDDMMDEEACTKNLSVSDSNELGIFPITNEFINGILDEEDGLTDTMSACKEVCYDL
jgi:hypothetical protein